VTGGEAMEDVTVRIDDIYVPAKRRKMLDAARVAALAESILELGQQAPILVRKDEGRLVLVEGLHRLEACKALGEQTITALYVQARKH
jgi:sulfiredoxin